MGMCPTNLEPRWSVLCIMWCHNYIVINIWDSVKESHLFIVFNYKVIIQHPFIISNKALNLELSIFKHYFHFAFPENFEKVLPGTVPYSHNCKIYSFPIPYSFFKTILLYGNKFWFSKCIHCSKHNGKTDSIHTYEGLAMHEVWQVFKVLYLFSSRLECYLQGIDIAVEGFSPDIHPSQKSEH